MRVAVASDDGKTIASHLGRTRGFIVFDVMDGRVSGKTYLENDFTGHARGLVGAGHGLDRHGPILEALAGCRIVIAHGMGKGIFEDLGTAGVEAFIVDETDPEKAVNLFVEKRLRNRPWLGCDHDEKGRHGGPGE